MSHEKFATTINCMDDRVQLPVIEWMKEEHLKHLKKAEQTIKSFGLDVEIIKLWVNEGWEVEKI